jgi:hypothetical protein
MRPIFTAIVLAPSVFAFQPPDPQAVLKRTLDAVGFPKLGGKILHWRDIQGIEENYQSSPPFFTIPSLRESWFDPQTTITHELFCPATASMVKSGCSSIPRPGFQ